jgi:hypothetical protein
MNLTQIHAIVEKYLKEHPEEWHNGMAFLVLKAVSNTTTLS